MSSANHGGGNANFKVLSEAEFPPEVKAKVLAARDALFGKLISRLTEVLMKAGPADAITVCSQEAPEFARAVSVEHGLQIGRTSLKLRNPQNKPPAWVESIVDASLVQPTFGRVGEQQFGALLPIRLQEVCLLCHGTPTNLAPGVPEKLAELYPDDKAVGYRDGELRGWFWIEIGPQ
ncbi:MAG TPA: DUF3365 domain-containing protein [Pirellulaceae bacterium]|nr:DUF3365 domain-containing protein [Pirellulaceae bacterium]HMO91597.1 DUF3365 domain-containing protein [Pirellulaceae bacterium]HMP68294.1 DUF3365 domain-containing protein [Pirellulaceae bacterium]